MADEQPQTPVFIPPLALMLAQAEKAKKAPLTETEVVRVRDRAVCIMMDATDATQMTARRGFVDVNPETCWSDWHRLRVEMTGNGYLPKIILCMLGDADFAARATPILTKAGVEHEFRERDERMANAFAASASPNDPSMTDEDLESISAHEVVLYFLSTNFTAAQAPKQSKTMLQVGRQLFDAGGLAMKCESSGIAHGEKRWIKLATEGSKSDAVRSRSALFSAYVQLPIQADDDFYTCGMHLLGKPDLVVAHKVLRAAAKSKQAQVAAAIELFRGFGVYLLAECAEGTFGSGHTFSLNAGAPKFRVLWEKCSGYDEDEFFFNPFGRWRFTLA